MPHASDSGYYRPCLIVAHGDSGYSTETCTHFRRQGWDVYQAQDGAEARRLARMLEPELVVLEADLQAESGWLTCAKLTRERPGCKVVLVNEDVGPSNRRMAVFSGALALVRPQDSLLSLVETLEAKRPAA
jgi:DNA-binding response OmpR family regulator